MRHAVARQAAIEVNVAVDEDFAKMPADGIIALQIHGGHVMEVTFRNIQFREIK